MAWKKRSKVCKKCGALFELETGESISGRKLCSSCASKKLLLCVDCGCQFVHLGGSSSRRCNKCLRKRKSFQVMLHRAEKDRSVRIGVGSGGNQRGVSNHAWNPHSTYRGAGRVDNFEARSICFMVWEKNCVVCSSKHRVQAHHINGNWKDNRIANVVPLCSSCHKRMHSKLIDRQPQALEAALFDLWPGGRIKIAEKIGNPEMWESEVKARRNGWASRNDYQMKPQEDEFVFCGL